MRNFTGFRVKSKDMEVKISLFRNEHSYDIKKSREYLFRYISGFFSV